MNAAPATADDTAQSDIDAAETLRAKFDSLDKDGSGSVDVEELTAALKDKELVKMLDDSGLYTGCQPNFIMLQIETGAKDKKITWAEFKQTVKTPVQAEAIKALQATFNEHDHDKSGTVSQNELLKALKSDKILIAKLRKAYPLLASYFDPHNKTGMNRNGRSFVFNKLDMNKDGKLTWQEFDDILHA